MAKSKEHRDAQLDGMPLSKEGQDLEDFFNLPIESQEEMQPVQPTKTLKQLTVDLHEVDQRYQEVAEKCQSEKQQIIMFNSQIAGLKYNKKQQHKSTATLEALQRQKEKTQISLSESEKEIAELTHKMSSIVDQINDTNQQKS